jgi:hypothetical protein
MVKSEGLGISGTKTGGGQDRMETSPPSSQESGTQGIGSQEASIVADDQAKDVPPLTQSSSPTAEQQQWLTQLFRKQHDALQTANQLGRSSAVLTPGPPLPAASLTPTSANGRPSLQDILEAMDIARAAGLQADRVREISDVNVRNITNHGKVASSGFTPINVPRRYSPVPRIKVKSEEPVMTLRGVGHHGNPVFRLANPISSFSKHKLNQQLPKKADAGDTRRVRHKASHESDNSNDGDQTTPTNSAFYGVDSNLALQDPAIRLLTPQVLTPQSSFDPTTTTARQPDTSSVPTHPAMPPTDCYWGRGYIVPSSSPQFPSSAFPGSSPPKTENIKRTIARKKATLDLERIENERAVLEMGAQIYLKKAEQLENEIKIMDQRVKIYVKRAEELRQHIILVNLRAGEYSDQAV